jgi:hypothetical protein
MPTSKRPNRSSSRRSSRRANRSFQTPSVNKSLDIRKLSDQFRRWKKRQGQSTEALALQLTQAQKALEFRGLQRQLKRKRFPALDLIRIFRPGSGEVITSRHAVAILLRRSTLALFFLTLVSIVFNSIPVRATKPEWYLQILSFIANSGPVIILAFGLGSLALYLAPSELPTHKFRSLLINLSQKLFIILSLLLPLQICLTVWLFSQAFGQERVQLSAVRSESEALLIGVKRQTTTDSFIAYLQSRRLSADVNAIRVTPLDRVKSELITLIQSEQKQREEKIRSEARQAIFRNSLDTAKLFLSLIIITFFSRLNYSMLKRSSVQGSLALGDSGKPSPSARE